MENASAQADRAVFGGDIPGIIVTTYQNERPLAGLVGLLDWRFHGALSRCVRTGFITGKSGECVYFPIRRNQRTFHLILAGAGHSASSGEREAVPAETWRALSKNLPKLGMPGLALSLSDFGGISEDTIQKTFKTCKLRILP